HDGANDAPLDILQRQIAALNAQALQAQRLSLRLQHVSERIAAGGETAADDWLNILELMNMYQKHLSDDELKTLLKPGPDKVQQTDVHWTALVAGVQDAMREKLPTDSAAAHALSWRWMRLVIRMTDN